MNMPHLASLSARLAARVLDAAIFLVPLIVDPSNSVLLLMLLFLIVVNLYMLSLHGQTIGKWICRIRIIDVTEGRPEGMTPMLLREIAHIITAPLFGADYLVLLSSKNKLAQCLHDMAVGTVVVDAKKHPIANFRFITKVGYIAYSLVAAVFLLLLWAVLSIYL